MDRKIEDENHSHGNAPRVHRGCTTLDRADLRLLSLRERAALLQALPVAFALPARAPFVLGHEPFERTADDDVTVDRSRHAEPASLGIVCSAPSRAPRSPGRPGHDARDACGLSPSAAVYLAGNAASVEALRAQLLERGQPASRVRALHGRERGRMTTSIARRCAVEQ